MRLYEKRGASPPATFANRGVCGTLLKRVLLVLLVVLSVYLIYRLYLSSDADDDSVPLILVVTPTHRRPERLADMTRFSQTLMHVRRLHWIVIEDATNTSEAVERILQRSGIDYTYLYTTSPQDYPKKGWWHRNMALDFIRRSYSDYAGDAVLYFADDDNCYDLRLFDEYIRRVKGIGIWAVGLTGGALVEAPDVENGRIRGWLVEWHPNRVFAVDMAGFAVHLQLFLNSNAAFNASCAKEHKSPESCFLEQLNRTKEEAEPFGWDSDPKEIMVWHTKTGNTGTKGSDHGYVTEK